MVLRNSTGEFPRSKPGILTPFRSPTVVYLFFFNLNASSILVVIRISFTPCARAVTIVLDALKTSMITQHSLCFVLFAPLTPMLILQLSKGISSQAPPECFERDDIIGSDVSQIDIDPKVKDEMDLLTFVWCFEDDVFHADF